MNEQIIYGIMTSTEGDNIGPFFETEADANDYIVKIKATEKGPIALWVSEETLYTKTTQPRKNANERTE